MKLAISLGYSGAQMGLPIETVLEAEKVGYDSVWTAESYGSDAITPLAYIAALTTKIKLGTSIMQIPGRTPAMAAMTTSTLDALSGGRMLVGLGLSGPQVVEGWHGVPYGVPGRRIREYVAIMRAIWKREEPVSFQGKEYQLPYTGEGATGLGKPLKSILHGRDLPIYLATLGPKNIELTGEIADGWLPAWFSPYKMDVFKPSLEAGAKRAGRDWRDLDIAVSVAVSVTNDVEAGLKATKPGIALYVGGMGARGKNFYNDVAVKYGYGDAAARIQELYLAGRKDEAADAVPDDFADEMALVGPPARIRERFRVYEDAGVRTMKVGTRDPRGLALMAEITGADRGNTD